MAALYSARSAVVVDAIACSLSVTASLTVLILASLVSVFAKTKSIRWVTALICVVRTLVSVCIAAALTSVLAKAVSIRSYALSSAAINSFIVLLNPSSSSSIAAIRSCVSLLIAFVLLVMLSILSPKSLYN